MNDEQPGIDELAQRLEAYASARLSPRREAIADMRASLIQDARMASLADSLAGRARSSHRRRRFVAALLAASLAVGSVASVAYASNPGGPLYSARIWLETTTLPTDTNARALERLHLIDSRVLDLEEATRTGDPSAVAAAAAAYREAVTASFSEAGGDNAHLATLEAALRLHVDVLEAISGRAPEQAQGGLSRAIQASTKVVDQIHGSSPNQGKPGAGGPGSDKSKGTNGTQGTSTDPSTDPSPNH